MRPKKRKAKRRATKSKTATPKKRTAAAKRTSTARAATKSAKKKSAQKKTKTKGRSTRKRTGFVRAERDVRQDARSRNAARSDQTPGDFQGLSQTEDVDSESVDELVEEGNVFEAGAVAGVEEADNSDEREVHTHEVPEDDVPEEYLDNDKD